jgi:hypothetical protein
VLFATFVTLAGVVSDLVTRGRVHRVYLWGGALIISVPVGLVVSGTGAWHALALWLTT